MYEMIMKKFLTDYALGMRAAEVWKRNYQATGGYLIGMMVATYFLGILAKRHLDQKFLTALPAMLFANVIIFIFGVSWLHYFTGKDWAWSINAGFTPFIIGEILKIAIAGTSLPILWRVVNSKKK